MPESYDGSEGTAAAAGGLSVLDGAEKWWRAWRSINKTRDMIANLKTWVVANIVPAWGSITGVLSAQSDLVAALNLRWLVSDVAAANTATANKVPRYNGSGQLTSVAPSLSGHVVDLGTLAAHIGVSASIPIYSAGGPAVSGYTIAYIDGTNRISKGASSERFKDDIHAIDPLELGDIFPQLHEFVMKDDPGRMPRIGYIAERLNESDALRRFVVYEREQILEDVFEDVTEHVYDEAGEFLETITSRQLVGQRSVGTRLARDEHGEPIPESIDFIALMLAQLAVMNARWEADHGAPTE